MIKNKTCDDQQKFSIFFLKKKKKKKKSKMNPSSKTNPSSSAVVHTGENIRIKEQKKRTVFKAVLNSPYNIKW